MSEPFFLLTFCNQSASPEQSGAILSMDGERCSWLDLGESGVFEARSDGLSGACRVDGDVIVATQSHSPALIRYNPVDGKIKAMRDLAPCRDAHSILFHDERLFVVSTGSNAIYSVPLVEGEFGTPQLHWRYPGVDYDRDQVHLNGLTASSDGLIATCFGPREANGDWGSEGTVFRIEPYQVLQGGLCQPHTPICLGDRLFFAESRSHRVHSLCRERGDAWRTERPIEVGGYARGLTCQGDKLWVGLSTRRRISRSRGTPNKLDVETDRGASIACVDLNTRTVSGRLPLGDLGDEIYDILILDDVGLVGGTADALSQRMAGVQAVAEMIRLQHSELDGRYNEVLQAMRAEQVSTLKLTQALQAEQTSTQTLTQALQAKQASTLKLMLALEAEQASTQELKEALQAEQAYSAQLADQLRSTINGRLFRAFQRLRRITGRSP